MAHNDFLRPYNLILPTTVLTGGDFEFADTMSVEGLQGDNGGTYSPKNSIGVGGAGFLFNECSIQGGVRTGGGGRLILGDSDTPVFPARTRTTVLRLARKYTTGRFIATPDGMLAEIAGDTSLIIVPIPPRYLQQGATLNSITWAMRVGQPHGSISGMNFPAIQIGRQTVGGTGSALGAAAFSAPDGDTWYDSGAVQTLTCACTTNNTIDLETYSYFAEFGDENSTGSMAGNLFISFTMAMSNIVDMRF